MGQDEVGWSGVDGKFKGKWSRYEERIDARMPHIVESVAVNSPSTLMTAHPPRTTREVRPAGRSAATSRMRMAVSSSASSAAESRAGTLEETAWARGHDSEGPRGRGEETVQQ